MHYACHPLKPHSSIYIRVRKRFVLTFLRLIKLRKYMVPKFKISVTITARRTTFLTATVLFSSIIKNFAAWATWAVSYLPKIILFPKSVKSISRYAYVFIPDFICLIIILIHRYMKLFRWNFEDFRDKLVSPLYGFFLKVIAEGEITKHFKKSAVSCRMPYIIYITCSYAFLRSGHPFSRRCFFT